MGTTSNVQFFLEDGLRQSAAAGQHNFLRLVAEVLSDAGLTAEYCAMSDRHRASGLSLTHMKAPRTAQGLVFRRVYHYPFWQIDQTDKRWDWDVAQTAFDPKDVPAQEARRFQRFWRKRLFPDISATPGDAVYVPLQGRLLKRRSFQSCSPLDMVSAVLRSTDRPVRVTLHPKETYEPNEIEAMSKLVDRYSNATLDMGGMEQHLPSCHCCVTQNSSAAFNGTFFDKPAILFAGIDFHHVAQRGDMSTLTAAIETPPRVKYARYLWWFWQDQSINAGRPEAKAKIKARLARFGWPVA